MLPLLAKPDNHALGRAEVRAQVFGYAGRSRRRAGDIPHRQCTWPRGSGLPPRFGRQYVGYRETRNLRMAANIGDMLGMRSGQRMLVIVGASHKGYFKQPSLIDRTMKGF
jgi:hypothetical protein